LEHSGTRAAGRIRDEREQSPNSKVYPLMDVSGTSVNAVMRGAFKRTRFDRRRRTVESTKRTPGESHNGDTNMTGIARRSYPKRKQRTLKIALAPSGVGAHSARPKGSYRSQDNILLLPTHSSIRNSFASHILNTKREKCLISINTGKIQKIWGARGNPLNHTPLVH
jgi:hypothetical protein